MRHYETTFILRPNLGEEQFTEIIGRACAIITDDNGDVINIDRRGVKPLAYEIDKEFHGYFVVLNYAAPGKTISELERILRLEERVLRYLTIKLADSINEEEVGKVKDSFSAETEKESEKAETEENAEVKEQPAS
jgi:small subunit ribosomal protein S6